MVPPSGLKLMPPAADSPVSRREISRFGSRLLSAAVMAGENRRELSYVLLEIILGERRIVGSRTGLENDLNRALARHCLINTLGSQRASCGKMNSRTAPRTRLMING
jgi:hypothetical protein